MNSNAIDDAEISLTIRERILKTLCDQTTLDSFFIDYFPEIKRNRFSSISNREDQINKVIEIEGVQAVQTAFEHYLRQKRNPTKSRPKSRQAIQLFFLGWFFVSILVIIIGACFFTPEYRAFRIASELQSSCNKGTYHSCQRLIDHYKNRCYNKNWDDCINLGDYYWLQQNKGQSYESYRMACNHDRSLGCFYMAILNETGDSVPLDENVAREKYETLCRDNKDKACLRLGNMYLEGRAVSQDALQAQSLYQKVCDQENPAGCHMLGYIYEFGAAKISKNITFAYDNYSRACNNQNYLPSCLRLGLLYYTHSIQDSTGTLAQQLFEKACAQGLGEIDACVNLGRIYEDGTSEGKNMERAIVEYRLACDKKNQGGCINLGLLFSKTSTPYYDAKKALTLLKSSCTAGVELGCRNYILTLFQERNNDNLFSDPIWRDSAAMLRDSCRKYDGKSCVLLGELTSQGYIDRELSVAALKEACADAKSHSSKLGCEWLDKLHVSRDIAAMARQIKTTR